jgi:hypothetical protein
MRPARRSDGQTLAEFALVFPIFILLLFALFDIGRLVFAYTSLTNAAREGARLAAVNQDEALIQERVQGQAPTVTPLAADIEVTFDDPGSAVGSDDCALDLSIGCIANVQATTTIGPLTPVLGQILGPVAVTGRSQLAIEFVCPDPDVPPYVTSAGCPKQP